MPRRTSGADQRGALVVALPARRQRSPRPGLEPPLINTISGLPLARSPLWAFKRWFSGLECMARTLVTAIATDRAAVPKGRPGVCQNAARAISLPRLAQPILG